MALHGDKTGTSHRVTHSKGHATYNTSRDTGVSKLPGESALTDYTNYIHPKTGF